MVQCPKCKKEIEHLGIDVNASCLGMLRGNITGFYEKDLVFNAKFGDEYKCPECDHVVCTKEEDAVHFLEGKLCKKINLN